MTLTLKKEVPAAGLMLSFCSEARIETLSIGRVPIGDPAQSSLWASTIVTAVASSTIEKSIVEKAGCAREDDSKQGFLISWRES